MSVKQRVLKLCEERNVKLGRLEREIKLSNGTIARWSDDSYPNSQTLAAIADYFKSHLPHQKNPGNKAFRGFPFQYDDTLMTVSKILTSACF